MTVDKKLDAIDTTASTTDRVSPNSYFRYDRSEEGWQQVLADRQELDTQDLSLDADTYDNWRHNRIRAPLKAIVESDPNASWLTVGDGRYGTDAHFLLKAGAKDVHCSDISDALLRVSSEAGFINRYSSENAENISFNDNTFDYVYCKEAFHHFPRPYLALYEMFRVAKKGVILSEPRDTVIDTAPIQKFRNALKSLVGAKSSAKHGFETVGNYAYALSEREVEKFLLGMHYTNVAFIGCNDFYDPGFGTVFMQSDSLEDRKKINRAKNSIKWKDFSCRIGVRRSTILTAALFKTEIEANTKAALARVGWTVKRLPTNPYI